MFSSDGHALGRARVPDGLDVYEIGSDYLLGLVRDDLEVERLRLHVMSVPRPLEGTP